MSAQRCSQSPFASSIILICSCCLALVTIWQSSYSSTAMVSLLSMHGNQMGLLAYCFFFTSPWCPSCASWTVFDWSDEGIRMMFPLSMMSFDGVSSLKVCFYGARACCSYLGMYPFRMDYDSACICDSLCIACCISLMVMTVGRQFCMMTSVKYSVSISNVLISLCMLLVCQEK